MNNHVIIQKLNELKNDFKKFNNDYYEHEGSMAVYEYIENKIKNIEEIIKLLNN